MGSPYDKSDYNPLRVFAFEALTVAGSSVGMTAATFAPTTATGGTSAAPAMCARIFVKTAPVRYRADGTAPTSTVGTLLNPGDMLEVWGHEDIAALRFIRTSGTSASLDCEYSR